LPLLGLDVGERRIGVALADESGGWVHAIETIDRRRVRDVFGRLAQLRAYHGVAGIIVGLPIARDGGETDQSRSIRRFGAKLRRTFPALWLAYADERMSTFAAEDELREAGLAISGGPGADAHAARHILAAALHDGVLELIGDGEPAAGP
jgi:putative Holliday junction resolvase